MDIGRTQSKDTGLDDEILKGLTILQRRLKTESQFLRRRLLCNTITPIDSSLDISEEEYPVNVH